MHVQCLRQHLKPHRHYAFAAMMRMIITNNECKNMEEKKTPEGYMTTYHCGVKFYFLHLAYLHINHY